MTVAAAKKLRVGDTLIERGLITQDQLDQALTLQKKTGRLVGEILVDQGVVAAQDLIDVLSQQMGIRGCVLREGLVDPELITLVSPDEAMRLHVLPMFRIHNLLTVAMAEPQSLPTIDRLRQMTGCRIKPVLAMEKDIHQFILRHTQTEVDLDALAGDHFEEVSDRDTGQHSIVDLDDTTQGPPVVRLINAVLMSAIQNRASDIHIEPSRTGSRIRCRVDGVLRQLVQPPVGMHAAIVSRVKVIGQMDIAEKRLPQDGRARLRVKGREIDLRLSSMPTLLGEKLVLRILDKENLNANMESLGFRPGALDTLKRILNQPYGLVLVTGPTGSGKTTTLYSMLDLLRNPETNIVTVEDPVEYQLDLINQVQVHEAVGMTFAQALRSILRQDPDVIMVGEIRDEETARVAVQAALTGHLVLATLHTNDAPSTVSRLLDMNVEPYLLSGALNGVVSQRLARTVCANCATLYRPEDRVLIQTGVTLDAGSRFRKGIGCTRCHGSGYQGRVGIYEVMEVSGEVRRLVHHAAASHELREASQKQGGLSLRQEGQVLAQAGKTTLEEVLRVTHDASSEEDELCSSTQAAEPVDPQDPRGDA